MHELGRRYVERGVFDRPNNFGMVRWDELEELAANPGALTDALRERQATYAELLPLEPTFVFEGEPPSPSTWPRRDARPAAVANDGEVLRGMPGCPGQAEGRARVVVDSHDPTALEPGDVLVAPITDPSWRSEEHTSELQSLRHLVC